MEIIQLQLFGGFRKYIPSGRLEIEVQLPVDLTQLKTKIAEALKNQCPQFSDHQLIEDSRFATAQSLIEDSQLVVEKKLAVLPPVCGG